MPQGLTDAIVSLRMDEALTLARRMLAGGTDPLTIIAESSEAMQVIGRRFADGEAFIPELIMGGEIMKSISQEVMPEGSDPDTQSPKGTVVIGTVRGDIHDIGKDIVALMLGHRKATPFTISARTCRSRTSSPPSRSTTPTSWG